MSNINTKELHRIDDMGIGIYESGFMVWEDETVKKGKTKGTVKPTKQTYHAHLHHALQNAALRVAGKDADTLEEYMTTYRDTARMLAKATGGV